MRFPISALLLVFTLWAPCSAVAQFDDDLDGFFTPEDCDDTNADIHPEADDLVCDGIDSDCDGTIETWYRDADADGRGTNSDVLFTCTPPPGYVAIGNDCDDTDPLRYPGATDPCDGFDADCDGNGERWYADLDEDGYGVLSTEVIACVQPLNTVALTGDCDDNDPNVFPGAAELCGDGLDNDCNGTADDQTTWYQDADGDGFGTESNTIIACEQPTDYSPNPGDCDDANAGVYPLAGPGIGCASCSTADQQYIQDQYSQIWNITGVTMAATSPGLTGQAAWNALLSGLQPFLTAISPSCRQCVVERAYCAYTSCATACIPWQLIGPGNSYPGTTTCNQCVALGGCNVAFNACVGVIDADGDGYLSTNDCNDLDPAINPFADEICDGIDNDCNGLVDDNLPLVYADSDGDGYGDPNALVMCATPGSVANNTDCDDTDTAIHPNAAELIDGIDNDCDGEVDEVQCNDVDGDGTTDCQGDCNDNEPSVFPGAAEICGDGLDNDCNGTTDDQTTWYQDTDSDGFGNESNALLACEQPIGYSPNPGDCDDADAAVYPLAGPGIGCSSCSAADRQWIADNYVAVWDLVGQAVVESHGASPNTAWNSLSDYLQLFLPIAPSCQQCVVERAYCLFTSCSDQCFPYEIVDHPLVGDGSPACHQCAAANGCNSTFAACVGLVDQDGDGVLSTADCDDTDATVYGDALELCDGIDNDCNGQIDEGVLITWFADLDGDGFGDNATGVSQCTAPPGFIDIGNDCDDTNSAINPGTLEACNGIDDDCSGTADDVLVFADLDGDGFGDVNNPVTCSFPDAVLNNSDCDDTDPNSFPGAIDACLGGDGVDNDCNGQVDEDGLQLWYLDADLDGSGVEGSTLVACTQPVGFAPVFGDCDDSNATVYPGAPELCDNLDNDCDPFGETDEGFYWYTDADGDGFGDVNDAVHSCTPILGRITIGGDCDDTDPAVHIPATLVLFWSDGLSAQYVITNGGNTYAGEILQAPLSPSIGVVNLCLTDGCVEVAITTSGTAESPLAQFGETVLGDVSGTVTFLSSDGLTTSIGEPALEVCDGVDNNCDGQVDEGCGGCTPADIAWTMDPSNAPDQQCLLSCSGPDPEEVLACLASCYVAAGLGQSCATCLVEYQYCVSTQCAECDTDPNSAACLQCRQSSGCDAAFSTCSGLVDADLDGSFAPFDCDDTNAGVYPDAPEGCTVDGLDNDCDGFVDEDALVDADNDGFTLCTGDCNDLNDEVNPSAIEICDGIDNNCVGGIDEGFPTRFSDLDGDGFGDPNNLSSCNDPGSTTDNTDCDDADATVFPSAPEICDGLDNDCNGTVDDNQEEDFDNDGFSPCLGDCDDNDATVFPGAPELCDGLDNDCNGAIETQQFADTDGDGFGDAATPLACGQPGVPNAQDCDDNDPLVTLPQGWFVDADGDGFGTSGTPLGSCDQPLGYAPNSYDCDDTNANVFPGQGCTECSPADLATLASDPFATVPSTTCTIGCSNEQDPQQCLAACFEANGLSASCADCFAAYQYCLAASCQVCLVAPESPACQQCMQNSSCAAGFTACSGLLDTDNDGSFAPIDCDDTNAAIYPGAPELCDGLDNNCDGQSDEGLPQQYADSDGDGYGDLLQPLSCDTPGVANAEDCDDNDPNVFPGSTVGFNCQGCSAQDQLLLSQNVHVVNGTLGGPYMNAVFQCGFSCSGIQDPAEGQACVLSCVVQETQLGISCGQCLFTYLYTLISGSCTSGCEAQALADFQACSGLVDADGDGYFAPADCDDQDPAISPGASEVCDGADNDCNGLVDDIAVFADADGDGYGDPQAPVPCNTPDAVPNNADCDDTDPAVNPEATEVCDDIDNDCDGIVDEYAPQRYADADSDGYGDPMVPMACDQPGAANNLDCDDTDANVFPEQGCGGCSTASMSVLSTNLFIENGLLSGPFAGAALQCGLDCFDPEDPAATLACMTACVEAISPTTGPDCDQCLLQYIADAYQPGCNAACRSQALEAFMTCSGLQDTDGDGYFDGADCAMLDPNVYPGADEVCDGIDNNCDGSVDEAGAYADADGDGYGDPLSPVACGTPGSVLDNTDCNDANPAQFPGQCPPCSPEDQLYLATHQADVDALFIEALTFCANNGQGFSLACLTAYVESSEWVSSSCTACIVERVQCQFQSCFNACFIPPGTNCATCVQQLCQQDYLSCAGLVDADGDDFYSINDCDDLNGNVFPGAPELCDGLDNDCDGLADEDAIPATVYLDVDGDGSGDDATVMQACPIPNGYVTSGGDCNDTDPSIFPGATEECDGIDNNCDGQVDEYAPLQYADSDGDGFGDPQNVLPCNVLGVGNGDDCNDADENIFPGQGCASCNTTDLSFIVDDQEYFRNAINDCTAQCMGANDPDCGVQCMQALDDLVGDICFECIQEYFLAIETDCAALCQAPNAVCDDCVAEKQALLSACMGLPDADGDLWFAPSDCDDTNPSVHPEAQEVCDNVDNDCDGQIDEDTVDSDGDGTSDCADGCPADPLKTEPGLCGCGLVDADTNDNGVCDSAESFPFVKLGIVGTSNNELEVRLLPNDYYTGLLTATVITVRWPTTSGVSIVGGSAEYVSPTIANSAGFLLYEGTITNAGFSYATFSTIAPFVPLGASDAFQANVEKPFFRVPYVNSTATCVEFEVVDNAFQDNENLQWFISLSGYERNNGYISGKTTAIAHPPLVCNNLQRPLNTVGTASLVAANLHGSISASCGAVLASASQTSFSCADIGVVPVTLTLAFPDGSTNTCVAQVTVVDDLAPIISSGSIAACYTDLGALEFDVLAATSAIDNCSGEITYSTSYTGSCSTDITVTATDAHGNSSSVIYSTRVDATAPVVSNAIGSLDVTVPCSDAAALSAALAQEPAATDNCAEPPSMALSSDDTVGSGCTYVRTRTWTFTDLCGNTATFTQTITVIPLVSVSMRVLLEGPYVENAERMNDDLRFDGLIPTSQPYASAPFNYAGTETVLPALLAAGDPDNAIVDWVLIELRDQTTPTIIVARCAALVQRDGDVVDVNGSGDVSLINVADGPYHVVVRHRNHLGVMTASPLALSSVPTNVDFTSTALMTYGSDASKTIGTKRVLWAGNALHDKRIRYTGSDNDRDLVLVRIGGIVPTNVVFNVYAAEDVNLDSDVKYTGPFNDRDPILVNIGGTVPTAQRFEQLP